MSTKSTRAVAQDEETTPANLTDSARQPMALAMQASARMLRAAEVVQQTNLQMLQRAALSQQQAAEKLREAGTGPELMSVQSGLWMTSVVEAVRYTSDLMNATVRLQSEMLSTSPTAPTTTTASSAGAGMAPMVQAWQNMFMAPLNAASQASSNVATTH